VQKTEKNGAIYLLPSNTPLLLKNNDNYCFAVVTKEMSFIDFEKFLKSPFLASIFFAKIPLNFDGLR